MVQSDSGCGAMRKNSDLPNENADEILRRTRDDEESRGLLGVQELGAQNMSWRAAEAVDESFLASVMVSVSVALEAMSEDEREQAVTQAERAVTHL
jgi:hypothetical protein